MAQVKSPSGSDHAARALGRARKVANYLAHVTFRPLKTKFCQSVPDQLNAGEREARGNERHVFYLWTAAVDDAVGSALTRKRTSTAPTGYLSLPSELRLKILEEVLAAGTVCPYRGLRPWQRLDRDWRIMRAAHLHACIHFIRHSCLWTYEVKSYTSSGCSIVGDATPDSLYPANFVPRCLTTCRTVFEEGLPLFYSKNVFFMNYGPLSISKDYFDGLQPKHKRLIRHMVLNIHWCDLTNEAFDQIEDQLRARDVAGGRLPPDFSVEDWVAPIVYQVVAIWRSKLAWLRDWTWLEDLVINLFLSTEKVLEGLSSDGVSLKIAGDHLPVILEGIGPVEPRCPVMDCYKECSVYFAERMRLHEEFLWVFFTAMIAAMGWKCTKAVIRKKAYQKASAARSQGFP
ncbi:MAG: hypothetical protein Q9168_005976 [Polycauliona sp. 1 TL-2023]